MKRAVFLDRDGIINELVYYPEQGIVDTPLNPSQVKLVFGIGKLISVAKKLGFLVIVISNQPAIGLEKLSKKDFEDIDNKIKDLLLKKGSKIDAYLYCLHHPYAKLKEYRKKCACHKPKIGLFKDSARDFNIDLAKSCMLGDGVDDVKAGEKAGCKTILLANINSTENLRIIEQQLGKTKPDFMVKKLTEVVEILKKS